VEGPFDLPGGVIWNGDLAKVRPVTSWNDDYLRQNVTESIARAYYDGDWSRGPWEARQTRSTPASGRPRRLRPTSTRG
jgi:hypothetical protein